MMPNAWLFFLIIPYLWKKTIKQLLILGLCDFEIYYPAQIPTSINPKISN